MMDEHDSEPRLGSDLLSCIEESLSHSTQANNYFPGMIAAFSNPLDINEEKLVQTMHSITKNRIINILSVCSIYIHISVTLVCHNGWVHYIQLAMLKLKGLVM